MERHGLRVVLLLVSSLAGAEFAPERCPCLSEEGVAALLGKGVDVASYPTGYGIGCSAHDRIREECQRTSRSCPMPEPCLAEWCWVEAENCTLNHRPSIDFPGLAKSYAACAHADPLPASFKSVLDRPLKICPKNNTGGYLGTYSDSVARSMDALKGAVPELVRKALERHRLPEPEIIGPDGFLAYCKNQTHDGRDLGADDGEFDCCVWVTSLGICDVCLTEATINGFRLALARFFPTSDEPRQIVAFVEENTWNRFLAVWGPFTLTAWLITILVPVPALVAVCVTHFRISRRAEHSHGRRRLCFQSSEVEDADQDHLLCVCCHLLCYKRLKPAILGALLLFGLRMYVEVTLVLYSSANLFHHLSEKELDASVETVGQVAAAGYVVGMQSTDANTFGTIHNPDLKLHEIARRVDLLNFMDEKRVAITTPQDLEVEQKEGRHCNKTMVGRVLQSVPMGIAISPMVADELMPKLQELRDDGTWAAIVENRKPESRCSPPATEADNSLSWHAVLILQGLVFLILTCGCISSLHDWRRALSGGSREPDPEGVAAPAAEEFDVGAAAEGAPRAEDLPELRLTVNSEGDYASPPGSMSTVVVLVPRSKTCPASLSDMAHTVGCAPPVSATCPASLSDVDHPPPGRGFLGRHSL